MTADLRRSQRAVVMGDDKDAALLRIAALLDRWATASREGRWSTHQVGPQRDLAAKIRSAVITHRYDGILP
jgi:hypothetical protein